MVHVDVLSYDQTDRLTDRLQSELDEDKVENVCYNNWYLSQHETVSSALRLYPYSVYFNRLSECPVVNLLLQSRAQTRLNARMSLLLESNWQE